MPGNNKERPPRLAVPENSGDQMDEILSVLPEKRVGAKVVNNLQALCQVTVPKIVIVIRKSYGQAAVNMCGPLWVNLFHCRINSDPGRHSHRYRAVDNS
jgi:hypothetical protein